MARFDASLDDYALEADDLFSRLAAGDDPARWRVKWLHPRFRGRPIADVRSATLSPDDARLVIARDYAFESWSDLEGYSAMVREDGAVRAFETAVERTVDGDVDWLARSLEAARELVRSRSRRRHGATLLHYVGANGVEQIRQRTPPNAVAIARLVLDAGADPNALAHFYDRPTTTMTMVVSSAHPARAGLQRELALLLLDRGAAAVDPGTGTSAIMTALTFGYLDTARAIEGRSRTPLGLVEAAGFGRAQDVERRLSAARAEDVQAALALAAQHGHVEVVRVLLDGGADPDRYCPEGLHAHATPLHQAVWSGCRGVVELLVARGARCDIRDTIYGSTPLEWAIYGHREEIAAYLGAIE